MLNKDFREFIELLNEHNVRYLVVEGREIDPDRIGELSRGNLWDIASRDLILAAASVERR